MAANRYGRIYHSDHHYINLRFASVDARREFAKKFEAYHAGHDHDGEPPRFEDTAASVIGNPEANRVHDAHSVSIDGYATYEIEDYHNPTRWNTYNQSRYRPPTCCVAPTISINRTFVDSSQLTRHELSAIFMDMPEEDFENLLKSVESEGFKDPVIRMIDAQVLDGWHRYRAAKELNLLRKLRFQQWDEKDEGDPAAFVYARNQNRRHHSKAVRAQIAVSFAQRFGHGGDRKSDESSHQNDDLKTRQELAKEAGVSTATIDRASQIEKAGRADEVIKGEKSAGEVITEETVKSLYEQINPAISEWKKAREGVGHASKTMFIKATLRWEGLPSKTETDVKVLKILLNLLTTTETNILEELVRKQLSGKSLWDDEETEATEQQATEPPRQTAEEREANTDLKRKQQAVKSIWDKRIEAARDYTGDADSELNLHLTLPELEKGFAKSEEHAYCADAFQSAIRRTSETSFNISLEKTLSSDVSLQALEAEYKALSTYALDILQWKRQAWIQQLIDKKRKKVSEAAETPPEPDMAALWEAFNKRLPKWKAKYAESGYKENDLIQGATEAELFDALRSYRHSDRTGEATAEEIQDITGLMKRQSYPYARHVRNLLRDTPNPDAEESDTETELEQALNALMEAVAKFDECFLHDADFHSDDYGKLCDLAAEEFNYDRDMLYQILFDEDCPEDFGVAALKKWEKIVCQILQDVKANAEWVQRLQAEVSAKERLVTAVEEDTSLDDLNLPALKSFLDSLMYHVKPVEHSITRDNYSVAVFDALVVGKDSEPLTEREQLSILLDCAQSIVTEYL